MAAARGHRSSTSKPQSKKQRGSKRNRVEKRQIPSKRPKKCQVFRFLDLPGELQNRIYEFAAEETRRSWPIPSNNACSPHISRRRQLRSFRVPAKHEFPFLGFTQTCAKIRSEFRGWWMENHRIPLCELDQYISVFLRTPPRKDRERFQAYFNTTGRLEVWIRPSELIDMDIIRLLKLKVRLSSYRISLNLPKGLPGQAEYGLNQLIHNDHSQWQRWIRGNCVSQVRLRSGSYRNPTDGYHTIHIVLNEKWAEDWMKPAVHRHIPDGFLATVGLDEIVYWDFSFSVNY